MAVLKKYLLECLGTFTVVFVVCTVVIIYQQPNSVLSSTVVALIYGVTIILLTLALGKTTGAHLNPAVTLLWAVEGSFPWRRCLPYWLAQFAGAFAASGLVNLLSPHSGTHGAILQTLDDTPAFVQEFGLSLLFLVASLSFRRDTIFARSRSALVTGAIAILACWITGPTSGTGMNPARALAPALLSGETTGLWIFLVAPVCAAFSAASLQALYDLIFNKKPAR